MGDVSIFKFRKALDPDFLPDHLPHREQEMKAISSAIDSSLKGNIRNALIFGPPGTGKTASIKFIFQKLKEETGVLPIYLNCFKQSTKTAVIYSILFEFFRQVRPTRKMISRRGQAYDELFDLFYSEAKKSKTMPVICFDEIDHLKEWEVLYDLTRLKEDSVPAQIIAISNSKYAFYKANGRIRSSLYPLEEIRYKQYDSEQIREIVKFRAEAAFQPDAVSEEVINHIAELTSDSGDIRMVRAILLEAGQLAKKTGRIKEEHVKAVAANSRFAKSQSVLLRLSKQERFILKLIPEKGVDFSEFYASYKKQWPEATGDRMFRNYIEKFEKLNLITMKRKGIGGAYFINLNIPREILFDIS